MNNARNLDNQYYFSNNTGRQGHTFANRFFIGLSAVDVENSAGGGRTPESLGYWAYFGDSFFSAEKIYPKTVYGICLGPVFKDREVFRVTEQNYSAFSNDLLSACRADSRCTSVARHAPAAAASSAR